MPWPLEPDSIREFAAAPDEILVWLPHNWISADYSLPSWEGQVQSQHPAKAEGEEREAQER
jgi:hypothetical protein